LAAWTCERHLKALLFAQFAGLKSLRESVAGLGGQSASFYHLNLRAPARTTLSDANAARPAAVFRDIAAALVGVAAGVLRHEGAALIRLIDATPIPLKDARFAWAEASARTRGLKLHLLYNPRQRRPVWFELTSAKLDDAVAGRAAPLEAGATYVMDKGYMDKGYTDFRRWSEIAAAGAFFVIRRKRNTHRREVAETAARGAGILADRRLKIGHRQARGRARGGAPHNPLHDTVLREAVVARPDKAAPLVLLTNDLSRPASEIAALYKERWEIELIVQMAQAEPQDRPLLGPQRKRRAHPDLCRADRLHAAAHPAQHRRTRLQDRHRTAARAAQDRPLRAAAPRPNRNAAAHAARPATTQSTGRFRFPMISFQNPGQLWAFAGMSRGVYAAC
jgi:IS4 transposase